MEIFEVAHHDNEQVIIKVNAEDALSVAMHPYVSSNMAYITVTRGENHVLTVVNKDGKHGATFSWGDSGYTLISDDLAILKKKVCEFIRTKGILLGTRSDIINGVEVFYNTNFKSWQATFKTGRGDDYVQVPEAESIDDMFAYVEKYVPVNSWIEQTAQTGIKLWKAAM